EVRGAAHALLVRASARCAAASNERERGHARIGDVAYVAQLRAAAHLRRLVTLTPPTRGKLVLHDPGEPPGDCLRRRPAGPRSRDLGPVRHLGDGLRFGRRRARDVCRNRGTLVLLRWCTGCEQTDDDRNEVPMISPHDGPLPAGPGSERPEKARPCRAY